MQAALDALFTPPGGPGARSPLSLSAERVMVVALITLSLGVMLPRTRTTAWGSANTKSRMAVVETLVHHGELAINKSAYHKTMDRVKIDGKLYSSKPPLLPVMIAGAYWVLHHTTGITFAGGQKKHNPAHVTLNLIFAGGALLLFLLALYLAATRVILDPFARVFTVAAGALGHFGAGYSVDINNHLPGAAVGMAAIACVLVIRSSRQPAVRGWYVAAGLFIGLLPPIDIPSTLLSIMLGLWLLVSDRTKALRVVLPVALIPIVVHMALTWSYTGGVLPVQMMGEAVWERGGYRGPRPDRLTYFFNLVIGHHGILSMVPLLGLGLWAAARSTREGAQLLQALAIILLMTFAAQFIFYMRKNNWGGTCVGARHFIPVIGWFMLYVGVFIEQRPRPLARGWVIALPVMLAVGAGNAFDATRNPWADSQWHRHLNDWGRSLERAFADPPPAKPKPRAAKPKARPKPRPAQPKRARPRPQPVAPERAAAPTPPPPGDAAPVSTPSADERPAAKGRPVPTSKPLKMTPRRLTPTR